MVVLCAVLIPVLIHGAHQKRYDDAEALIGQGEYSKAKEAFSALGGFDDSELKMQYCQNMLGYEAAKALMDNGDYASASAAFAALGDFEDAAELVTECENELDYLAAVSTMESGDYATAKSLFTALGTYKDAGEKAVYCDNMLAYISAEQAYSQKQYYLAYIAFGSLGDFEDAAACQQACVQAFPSTGETYRNSAYVGDACTLAVVPPSDDASYNYVKIYTSGDVLVSCVAVQSGESVLIDLPAGTYKIKTAYGYGGWFGEEEMFGDDGVYQVLTYDDYGTDTVSLESNYDYTLTLRTNATENGVGSYSENREDF